MSTGIRSLPLHIHAKDEDSIQRSFRLAYHLILNHLDSTLHGTWLRWRISFILTCTCHLEVRFRTLRMSEPDILSAPSRNHPAVAPGGQFDRPDDQRACTTVCLLVRTPLEYIGPNYTYRTSKANCILFRNRYLSWSSFLPNAT